MGIVVGVLVFLAVILGVFLLLLRKKKQRAATGIVWGEREGGGSDKIVVQPGEAKDNPHNNTPRYTELLDSS